MNRFGLPISMVVLLFAIAGCAGGAYNLATVSQQETGDGYCHKRLEPVGPSDLIRPAQAGGDYIDYYGPCNGPSVADQIQKQRRFESFRFGRDYMDEG